MAGQTLLIAALLGLVFGRLGDAADPAGRATRTANLLLLLAVSCFWFGCNAAAKELVKERAIFRRERDFNIRVGGYLASKLLVLAPAAAAQATLLFLVARAWCEPPGPAAPQWLLLAALAAAGTAAGLLISALARSEEVATALVPIAVLPQIILSGAIAPLGGLSDRLARGLIATYWGQRGLVALLPGDWRLPASSGDGGWGRSLLVLAAHSAALGLATLAVLRDGPGRSAR